MLRHPARTGAVFGRRGISFSCVTTRRTGLATSTSRSPRFCSFPDTSLLLHHRFSFLSSSSFSASSKPTSTLAPSSTAAVTTALASQQVQVGGTILEDGGKTEENKGGNSSGQGQEGSRTSSSSSSQEGSFHPFSMFWYFWGRYAVSLAKRPLLTKMATYGVVLTLADLNAQFNFPPAAHQTRAGHSSEPLVTTAASTTTTSITNNSRTMIADTVSTSSTSSSSFDLQRTLRLGIIGVGFIAPMLHVWFAAAEYLVPGRQFSSVIKKIALELVFLSPLMCTGVFTANGLLQGHSSKRIQEKIRRDFLPTYTTAIFWWGAVGLINYQFVPLQYRVLFVTGASFFWNTFLSVATAKPAPLSLSLSSSSTLIASS